MESQGQDLEYQKQVEEYEEAVIKHEERIQQLREFALSSLPTLHNGMFAYATETMKALILINSGSAAAILAFIGHLVTINQRDLARALSLPLCIFLISAISAIASFGFSYLSQGLTNLAYMYLALWREEDQGRYQSASRWGTIFQCLAILATLIAFGVCLWGIWKAYGAFMSF
jgi:hypothetical protein